MAEGIPTVKLVLNEAMSWNASIDSFGCPVGKDEEMSLSENDSVSDDDDEPKRDLVSKMIKLASFRILPKK